MRRYQYGTPRGTLTGIEHTDGSFSIENMSPFDGVVREMPFPMTRTQFEHRLGLWNGGEMIQTAFRTLSANHREFLLTGITPEEWEETFSEEEK